MSFAVFGRFRCGCASLALNGVAPGSVMSLRSIVIVGAVLIVLDVLYLGSFPFLWNLYQWGSVSFPFGVVRYGSCLSALDFAGPSSRIPARSIAYSGSALSVLGFLHSEVSLLF